MAGVYRPLMLRCRNQWSFKISWPACCPLRRFHDDSLRLPCPWDQNYPDASKEDPFLHRLFGTILLKRVVKNLSGQAFSSWEFGLGVQHAIKTVIDEIPSCHQSEALATHLGTELYQYLRKCLDLLAARDKTFHLEIQDLGDWRITGVRAVFGSSDPLDEYVISFMGQHMITSKSVLDEVAGGNDFGGKQILDIFREGKKLGQQSFSQGLRFQVNVLFRSNERAFLSDPGQTTTEVRPQDAKTVLHNWLFESPVKADGSGYPLDWKIVDMNNLCHWRKVPS